ncbi:hypothetical protein CCAX7_10250 [Capsulimonas corticalis]|uniref:Uncharacterized protein n=1 Tax=Capsulimonas corticalis TaxID=2219043 RepID=A0A402CUI5_9BACT|nr:RICIN domain-containing protein [Capsulimonas corticalis]BDI28974.1 hypothetical protein CCAX7_10250 [Capsulimonas corticalis]
MKLSVRVSAFALTVGLALGSSGARAAIVAVGDPNNPGALYGAIMNAYNTGATGVTVNAGTYNIPVNTSGGNVYAWVFQNMSNFSISGTGVKLNFSDTAYQLINFNHDTNLTFQGFQMTGPPNFTQGKIYNTGSDGTGNYMDVTLDAGYPTDWSNANHWGASAYADAFQVFDQKTRRWKPGTGDYGVQSWPPTTLNAANRQYRFYLGGNTDMVPANGRVVYGDYVAVRGYAGRYFNVDTCTNLTFSSLTVSTANANMWQASNNRHIVIDSCNFVYQPTPAAGGNLGLLGPDGILSGNNYDGLIMTNTTWQGSNDDVINSDAGSGQNVGTTSGNTLTFTWGGVASGDVLYFYDTNGNFLGQDTATSNSTQVSYSPPDNTYGSAPWYNVTLSQPFSLGYKYRIFDINHTSHGFTMKNDIIQNFRDVGVIVADNSDIENCIFDGGTVAAIVTESYANNMVIKNNVFSNNCLRWNYGNKDGGRNAGAIQMDNQYYYPGSTGQTFQNTLIQNNIFYGNDAINIAIVNGAGTQITRNAFVNAHPAGPGTVAAPAGMVGGQDSNTSVWLSNDNFATLSGNTVSNDGPYGTLLAELGPNCANVRGVSSGVSYGNTDIYYAASAVVSGGQVRSGGGSAGGQYVGGLDAASSYVKFTVNVPVAGQYAVLVAYDNNSNVDQSAAAATATHSLVVNGNTGSPITVNYPYTGAWGSFSPTFVTGVYVTLNAGANTLQFNHGSNRAELDNIQVVIPQGTSPLNYYKLFNQNSGKVLAVVNASTANGANAQQYTDNGTPDHNWKFVYAGYGYFKIVNQNSGRLLEDYASSTANGAPIDQWDDASGANQLWKLVDIGGGYYKVINKSSGKLLEVTGSSTSDGALVDQNIDTGGANQHWKLQDVRSGTTYRISNSFTGKVLTPSGGGTADGTLVTQWDDNGTGDHLWQLQDQGCGLYKFLNTNSGRELGITGGSLGTADAVIWGANGATDHLWQLLDAGSSFSLFNWNSGLVLGVNGMSTANGAEIFQTPENYTGDHLWTLK